MSRPELEEKKLQDPYGCLCASYLTRSSFAAGCPAIFGKDAKVTPGMVAVPHFVFAGLVAMQAGAKSKRAARPGAREDTAPLRTPSPAPTEIPTPPTDTMVEPPTLESTEPAGSDWHSGLDQMIPCQPVDCPSEPEPDPLPDVASGSKDDPRTVHVKDVLKSVSKSDDMPLYDDNNPPSSTSSDETPATAASARGLLKLAKKEASQFFIFFALDSLACSCSSIQFCLLCLQYWERKAQQARKPKRMPKPAIQKSTTPDMMRCSLEYHIFPAVMFFSQGGQLGDLQASSTSEAARLTACACDNFFPQLMRAPACRRSHPADVESGK